MGGWNMATEGRLEVELLQNNSTSVVTRWSLECEIIIEDVDASIQEVRVSDIVLAGAVITGDFPVSVGYDGETISLDVAFTIDGLNPNIVESQVVPYENILGITDFSPETENETRYASSAYSAKRIYDLISALKQRVDIIESSGGGEGGGGTSSQEIQQLLQLLDWFEYDPENNMIRANHGLYSFGPLASGGTIEGVQVSAINRLARLRDVAINDVKDGQSLVYDEESMTWVNRTVEGGEGGSASLTESIKAGVKVGNINVGAMLEKGMTFTEFVEMMFSEDITKVSPSVTIANTPAVNEVGDTVIINPTYTFTDGYFKNAKGENDDVNPKAQCEAGRPRYLLNGSELSSIPYELSTDAPKKYTIEINLPYSESKAKVYKKSGDEYTEKIPSGTAKDDAEFNVCYKWFWGYVEKGKTMSSEVIRALRHSGFISPGASSSTLLSGQEDTEAGKSVVIACPEEYRLSGVKDMAMGGGESMSSKFKQGDDVVVTCGKTHNKKYHIYMFTPTSGAGSIKIGNIEIAKN